MRVFRFCLFLGILFSGCHGHEPVTIAPFHRVDDHSVSVSETSNLQITKLEQKKFPLTLDLPGRVTIPDKNIFVLSSRVQGRVETVSVSIGDSVSTGQVIATLWSPDLVTAVEELEIAKRQNSESLVDLSKQKLGAMGLSIEDAVTGQKAFPIRSPISGVVIDKKQSSGSSVQPGDSILTIGKLDSYQFVAELTPEQAMKVRPGLKVIFEEDANLRAVVQSVSPVPDPISRLVKVRCSFDRRPPMLPQETLLKGRVVLREIPSLVAPSKSIILTSDGEYVFFRDAKEKNLFRKMKVTISNRNKQEVSIEPQGVIVDGIEVVSDGALLLNDVLDGNG